MHMRFFISFKVCIDGFIRDITRKDQFIIRQSTLTKTEVEELHEGHEVDIEKKDCSRGFWQLSGLPCIHIDAFIGTIQHSLWCTYVDDHYYVYRYKMAYDGAISTLPEKEQWDAVSDGEIVTPPASLRPRGRPKKRQIKNFLEIGNKRKLGHKYSRCNLRGHHRSSCKNPLNVGGDEIGSNELMPCTRNARPKLNIRRPGSCSFLD